jgi:hypothetical protein
MSKKKAKKKTTQKKISYKSFSDWWDKVGSKEVDKIEKAWLKNNKPNDDEDEGGGDHWHVNQMMHNGDAHEMTYEKAEYAFEEGLKGKKWTLKQDDSLYCDLDEVTIKAYEAGKALKVNK